MPRLSADRALFPLLVALAACGPSASGDPGGAGRFAAGAGAGSEDAGSEGASSEGAGRTDAGDDEDLPSPIDGEFAGPRPLRPRPGSSPRLPHVVAPEEPLLPSRDPRG